MERHPPAPATLSFDSILVRLKAIKKLADALNVEVFRFHTGSIKSDPENNDYAERSQNVSIPYWFD